VEYFGVLNPIPMKAITTLALVFVVFTSNGNNAPVPQTCFSNLSVKHLTDVFSTFHIHRQGDFASLNWNVNSDDIVSFTIDRSYDGQFFSFLDNVTPDAGRWNRYLDTSVEPGFIWYQITAVMKDGSSEQSTIEMVKIVKHK
jgi:hypothetical protein